MTGDRREAIRELRREIEETAEEIDAVERRIRRLEARSRRQRELSGAPDDTPEIQNGDKDVVPTRAPKFPDSDGWFGQ